MRACRLGLQNFNVGTEHERYIFACHYGSATGYHPPAGQEEYFTQKHGFPPQIPESVWKQLTETT